jgi:hypothetical protein
VDNIKVPMVSALILPSAAGVLELHDCRHDQNHDQRDHDHLQQLHVPAADDVQVGVGVLDDR